MRYLVDTDVCINIIRSKDSSILKKVFSEEIEQMSISSITVAELECGAAKSSNPAQASLALAQFLSAVYVWDFDQRAACCYGKLRAELEKEGKRIGPYDMLIAAQALAEKLVLITNNYREFERVKGLCIESWSEFDLADL